MPDGRLVAKIDFSNAFNSLHWDLMLRSVAEKVPSIYRFCHLSYSQPSILKYETRTILSQEGPHKGDPLGPLLFCLSIHPDLEQLKSELIAGFMDDLTLGGPADTVAAEIDHIRGREAFTGLQINASKCEIISHGTVTQRPQFNSFIFLALLSAHDALILFRLSFIAPKMMHMLRCSPCAKHPSLEEIDSVFKKGICAITNWTLQIYSGSRTAYLLRRAPSGLDVRRV